jgi:hypothetical protein
MTRLKTLTGALLLLAVTSAHAETWNRDAAYSRRVAEFQAAVAARPNDVNALVDLASFYL